MCDLAADYMDSKAADKQFKLQQANYEKSVGAQRQGFDQRQGYLTESTGVTNGLLDREFADTRANQDKTFADLMGVKKDTYGETAALRDQTFDFMLGQNRTGFDEQQTIAGKAFDDQMAEMGGLMTTTRRVRLEQQATVEAERARQQALQGEADGWAFALPDKIGFTAQETARVGDEAARNAFARLNTSAADTTAPGGSDPQMAAMFARMAADGVAAGQAETAAGNKLSAYSAGGALAEREMRAMGDAVRGINARSRLSEAPLAAELGVGDIERANARDLADWTTSLIASKAGQDSTRMANYRSAITGAEGDYAGFKGDTIRGYGVEIGDALSRFGQNADRTLTDYYGRNLDAEARRFGALTDASSRAEQARIDALNYKSRNTTVTSPLATFIRTSNNSARQAAAAGA